MDYIIIITTSFLLRSIIIKIFMKDLCILSYFLGIDVNIIQLVCFCLKKNMPKEFALIQAFPSVNMSYSRRHKAHIQCPLCFFFKDPTLFRVLQYLNFTRPNIFYAVQHVCLYMHNPMDSICILYDIFYFLDIVYFLVTIYCLGFPKTSFLISIQCRSWLSWCCQRSLWIMLASIFFLSMIILFVKLLCYITIILVLLISFTILFNINKLSTLRFTFVLSIK